jgi:hypothetical protein
LEDTTEQAVSLPTILIPPSYYAIQSIQFYAIQGALYCVNPLKTHGNKLFYAHYPLKNTQYNSSPADMGTLSLKSRFKLFTKITKIVKPVFFACQKSPMLLVLIIV